MMTMNVREDESVQKGVKKILSWEDRLDVVVNNAGNAIAGSAEDCPLKKVKNHPNPLLGYTAGSLSQRMAAIIKRIAPGRFLEWGVRRSLKLSN